MTLLYYALATMFAIMVGIASGLGPGLIMKPLFDLMNLHSVTEIGNYISIAFLPVLVILTYRFFKNNKAPVDWKRVATSACGAITGGILGEYFFEFMVKTNELLVKQIQTFTLVVIIVIMLFYFLKKVEIKEAKIETKAKVYILSLVLSASIIFLGFGGRGLNLAAYLTFFPYDKKEAPLLSIVIIFCAQVTKLTKIALTSGFGTFDPKVVIVLLVTSTIGSLLGYTINKYVPKKYINPISIAILIFVGCLTTLNLIRLF
ncbi:MAG: sulfite exporter TauE/SafE family protein [Anaerorhabdus sp.]|uniref:sulfite exporter TauE/SafE family protein n=1 Tax=Anaerorhabdus sp. TaxID=1872524 RepID=UPI002FCB0311